MEKSHYRSFKLGPGIGTEGNGREAAPENVFAYVAGNEEGNTMAKAIALLQEVIQEDTNESGNEELEDDKRAIDIADFGNRSVLTRIYIG